MISSSIKHVLPPVFAANGINAPETGWNPYAGINLTGKIAAVLVNPARTGTK